MRLITKSGFALASTATASAPVPAALSPHFYLDPEVLPLEDERIFSRTWQFAGHVTQISQAGNYITANAGSQPVLVVRDDEGELRAFRNVCRHRGSRLLSGSGECKKAIRCRYHGWTYRMDGELIGVPEGRRIAGLDKSSLGLFPARVEVLCGLVFVNLDIHAPPLAEQVAGLPERLEPYGLERLRPVVEKATSQPANWKIVVDNYLEGYHVPIAHPGLMRLVDYKNYDVELFDNWVWFDAPLRDKPSGNFLERTYQRLVEPMPGLGPEHTRVWRYILIYPNTTIDLYPDQIGIWHIVPQGVDATHDVGMTLLPRGGGVKSRAIQYANRRVNQLVSDEDVDLVANQQAGIATKGFEPGPLSRREAAVGWFADKIRADLGEAG
jgi:choline monooxygenase